MHPYFQWRLVLGVFPMAPFPDNDHSIPADPVAQGYYDWYGHMFRALQGKDWSLVAHAITVNDTNASANAFETPGGTEWLYPITLGVANPVAPSRTILITVHTILVPKDGL